MKRIRLTESQLYNLIKEAFEDNENWRTDVLKGHKKYRQSDAPRRRANYDFVSPEMQQRYQSLADKREQEADDLYKNASDKFNRRYWAVKRHNPNVEDWEFRPNKSQFDTERRSKGIFTKRIPMGNYGFKDTETIPSALNGWEGVEDRQAIKDIDNFVGEKPYYDEDLNCWVDDGYQTYDKDKAKAFWKSHGFGESLTRRVTENVPRKLNEGQVPEFFDLEHYIASEILDVALSGDNRGDLEVDVDFPCDNGDKIRGTVYFRLEYHGSLSIEDIYPDLKIYYPEFNTCEDYECDIDALKDALYDDGNGLTVIG